MRRLMRLAVLIVVLGALLLMVAWITLVTNVDRRSFVGRPHDIETRRSLSNVVASERVISGPLRAGFGRASLVPLLGAASSDAEVGGERFREVPLAGYGQRRGRPATGTRDELWAKAVAFAVEGRTGVVVSVDGLIVPREIAEAVIEDAGKRNGLGRDGLYFGATHTHSGLGGWGEGWVSEQFAGPRVDGLASWMATRITDAIETALHDLRPAEWAVGGVRAPEWVRQRLDREGGLVDDRFRWLLVRQLEGSQVVLGSYAAHATVIGASSMEFSGDYPGAWQRAMENSVGGMAVFVGGAMGSHAPSAGASGWEAASSMGTKLAERVLEGWEDVEGRLTNEMAFGMRTLVVRLPALQVRLAENRRLRPIWARQLVPVREDTWLQAWRIGDSLWLSAPADYSGELALELEASFSQFFREVVVTSFNGDYIGYVVPERYDSWNTYESRTMSFFGPSLSGYFQELFRGLAGGMDSGTVAN